MAYGRKDYKAAKENFLRGFFTFGAYVCILFLPIVLNAGSILAAIGIDHEIAAICSSIQIRLFALDVIRLTSEILMTFCICQGVETSFGPRVILHLFTGLSVGYFFSIRLDYGLHGWMIGRAIFDVLNLVLFISCYFTKTRPDTRGLIKP